MFIHFARQFKMFTLISFVLLGVVVKVNSEQIQCQMVPIKTENGLVGHCCMFSKDTSSEEKRDRLIEQILKNRRLLKHTPKPLDGGMHFEGPHHLGSKPPPPDEPMVFLDNREDKYMGERYGMRRKPVLHVQIKTVRPRPHQKPPKFPDGTTPPSTDDQAGRVNFSKEDNSSGEVITIPAETNDTIPRGESAEDSTDKDVVLDNRFNINAPKTCTGDNKKTNKGECETAFG